MSPLERADAVVAGNKEIWDTAKTTILAALNSHDTPNEVSLKVSMAVGPMTSKVAEMASCRKGCSHCCKQAVAITAIEAHRIGTFIGRPPFPVKHRSLLAMVSRITATQEQYKSVPCPFLKDDECSVYPVRPLVCRTHFSLGEPKLCDTTDPENGPVPYFNFMAVVGLNVEYALSRQAQLSDIRDFFPSEDQNA